jgi:hypothetical protein
LGNTGKLSTAKRRLESATLKLMAKAKGGDLGYLPYKSDL